MKKLLTADTLIIGGALVTAGGVGWIHLPAGVIVLGLAMVAVGVLIDIAGEINKKRKRRQP